jgi:rhodanese-related sulfurtransferase
MRCSSAIATRRSSSSATTASAASTPAEYFREQGFRNLYNLRGGIDAWSLLVDPSVPRY